MKLKRSLYGLWDAARIWYDLLTKRFNAAGLAQLHTVPRIFRAADTLVICYVDDLLVFQKICPTSIDYDENAGQSSC